MKKNHAQEKELLLIKAEALRLQLLLDVHQSKASLKPAHFAWNFLGWVNGVRILRSAIIKGKNRPVKTALSVLLASAFLFRKHK